jgi:RNA polymerase sigma-70 factor (ECF subfamily)
LSKQLGRLAGLHLARPEDRSTETELIAQARAGDVEAFGRLAGAHTDHLYTVVLRLVGDRGEAEDVVQEALLRAWRGIGRFQGRSLFFTWLYRIAVNEANRALDKRSQRGRSVDVEDDSIVLPAPSAHEPANQAEHHELRRALDHAIAELDGPYRTALVLRDIEGFSTREAAEIVGVGEAAFKSRLHQARLKVRAVLGDETLTAGAL